MRPRYENYFPLWAAVLCGILVLETGATLAPGPEAAEALDEALDPYAALVPAHPPFGSFETVTSADLIAHFRAMEADDEVAAKGAAAVTDYSYNVVRDYDYAKYEYFTSSSSCGTASAEYLYYPMKVCTAMLSTSLYAIITKSSDTTVLWTLYGTDSTCTTSTGTLTYTIDTCSSGLKLKTIAVSPPSASISPWTSRAVRYYTAASSSCTGVAVLFTYVSGTCYDTLQLDIKESQMDGNTYSGSACTGTATLTDIAFSTCASNSYYPRPSNIWYYLVIGAFVALAVCVVCCICLGLGAVIGIIASIVIIGLGFSVHLLATGG